MDGVLIDARDWHFAALNHALAHFGHEISEIDHQNIYDGLPTRKKLEMLSSNSGLPLSSHEIISRVKQNRTLRIAAERCVPNSQHLLLLGRLKSEGLRVGVATNSIRKTARFMLEYAGLMDMLDSLITNEDVKHPKPNPEIYLRSMELLALRPKETLVFEDNKYGVEAARQAGCNVIEVSSIDDVNLQTYFSARENY